MPHAFAKHTAVLLTAAVLSAAVLTVSARSSSVTLLGPLGDMDGDCQVGAPDMTALARQVSGIVPASDDVVFVSADDVARMDVDLPIRTAVVIDDRLIVTYTDGTSVDFGKAPEVTEEVDTSVVCRGNTATVTGSGVTQEDDVLRITAAGSYRLSGLWEGRIVVSVPDTDDVKLVLTGFTATCASDAVLTVESANKVTIKNQRGFHNVLRDTDTSVEKETDTRGKGAIYARCSLEFSGAGSMTVSSAYKHAVACTKKLTVHNGTLELTAADCGLKGNNSVLIEGGSVRIRSKGDGIKTEDNNDLTHGVVEITGGELTVVSDRSGINASRAFDMSGGTVSVTALGRVTQGDTEEGSKGVKAGGSSVGTAASISITGGTLTVTSVDHAIRSTGDVTIDALADVTVSSSEKGIQAQGELTVGGGAVTVVTASEGIESKGNMYIDGGTVTVYATDDGLNVGGSGKCLYISGGFVDVTTAAGQTEGIDSNGDVEITGGFVLIQCGSVSGGDVGSINVDGKVTVTGGTVVALGGICETPSGAGMCCVARFPGKTFAAGDYELTCDGETAAVFTLDVSCRGGWISCEGMTQGSRCVLLRDGSTAFSWTQSAQSHQVS